MLERNKSFRTYRSKMIVIVTGMHRSGTSAVAGLLHRNGIVMGENKNFKPRPLPQNPKGFYENVRFRNINDEILQTRGYKVKSFRTNIPKMETIDFTIFRKMKDLVEEYSKKYDNWGFKDPRTCLTLKFWLQVMKLVEQPLKILVVSRPFEEIATSLAKRKNCDKKRGRKLAGIYFKRLVEPLRENILDVWTVDYPNLCEHTATEAKKLSTWLGIGLDDISFIDKELRRNVGTLD
jgi:hypothetical protein